MLLCLRFCVHTIWFMVCLLGSISGVFATGESFQWQFEFDHQRLSTCDPVFISVQSSDSQSVADPESTVGIPPYYMISFAAGGLPVTSAIGSDINNLSWAVAQPPQSHLILSVVDSVGNSGGVAPQAIDVVAGQSTDCVVGSTGGNINSAFNVSANFDGYVYLEPCIPWEINVSGGTPPYVITFAETGTSNTTNVTLPITATSYTYTDSGASDGQLIAAVSDAHGDWAIGTPSVTVAISPDNFSCSDLSATSAITAGTTSNTVLPLSHGNHNSAHSSKQVTITLVAISIAAVIVLVIAVIWMLKRRRYRLRSNKRDTDEEQTCNQRRRWLREAAPNDMNEQAANRNSSQSLETDLVPTSWPLDDKSQLILLEYSPQSARCVHIHEAAVPGPLSISTAPSMGGDHATHHTSSKSQPDADKAVSADTTSAGENPFADPKDGAFGKDISSSESSENRYLEELDLPPRYRSADGIF